MADADLIAQKLDRIERDKNEVKERTCLMCGMKFLSSWNGNRICRRCKHLDGDHSLVRSK